MSVFPNHRRYAPILGVVVAAWLVSPASAEEPTAAEIELSHLNSVYENLDSNLEPIRQGSMTIVVSSPDHRLTVHGNRLRLSPLGTGGVQAEMSVDFEGAGQLIADVSGIGRFTDRVQAPRQTVSATGTARIERLDAGYLFTVLSADPAARLEIQSGVAGQIVSTCRAAALIPFVSLPCDGLETALAYVDVPLPRPGEQLFLPAEDLTVAERAFFDRFVAED